jgi:choice-of-anchor B domain-containing protein
MRLSLSIIAFCLSLSAFSQVYSSSNFTLVGQSNPEISANTNGNRYSGCWGWTQPVSNKEYAILGSQSGTYWIDITNPSAPVTCTYFAGTSSNATWRELKTYQNYCYVIADDAGAQGLQIFDMSGLPATVTKVYESKALFARGHACWMDGSRFYVSGVTYSNNTTSAMNIYDLSNPTNPVLVRSLSQDDPTITYVHDMFVRNDTIYASAGYQGLHVYKRNSNNSLTKLGSLTTYPGSGYNHSSALTPNGPTLVFTDEVPASLPVKVANVTNPSNITIDATTNQYSLTTPHNPFMLTNQYVIMSSYKDGVQLFDISNPAAPFVAGYFDTYPQGGANTGNYGSSAYNGNWGAYPFYPSKTVFALDMRNGAFYLKSDLLSTPTSLNQLSQLKNLTSIFPNPSSTHVTIENKTSPFTKVEIFDASGKLVHQSSFMPTNKNDFYLALNKGIYFVNVFNQQELVSKQELIIQ